MLFRFEGSRGVFSIVFGLCFTLPKSFESSVSEFKEFICTISISSVFELSFDVDFLIFFVMEGDTSGDSVSVRAELSETAKGAAKKQSHFDMNSNNNYNITLMGERLLDKPL